MLKGKEIINFKTKDIEYDNRYIEEKEVINNEVIDMEKQEENEQVKELSNDEIKGNYIKATAYYEEAKKLLEDTINKSNTNYLDDDILFLLASTYESYGNINKAIENYDKYILNYKAGSYIKEVYYRAALLYKDMDIEKSKEYANEIIINYPNSIYNNNYVKEIMKL